MKARCTSRERLVSAEEEIRRAHERTERVLENMPIGVVTASADGVVTRANRAAREMLALRGQGDPDGRALAEVVGALSPALAEALEGILVTRRWAAREEVLLRDGSQERPIGVSIAPLIEERKTALVAAELVGEVQDAGGNEHRQRD